MLPDIVLVQTFDTALLRYVCIAVDRTRSQTDKGTPSSSTLSVPVSCLVLFSPAVGNVPCLRCLARLMTLSRYLQLLEARVLTLYRLVKILDVGLCVL